MYSVCFPKFRRWLPQKSVILLAHVSSSADSVILVGDFNLPDVCWSSLIGQSPFSNSFCDFVYEHNFSQLVDCPTHVKGNILDLVFTTSESIISDLLVTRPHALISTDHHTVSFNDSVFLGWLFIIRSFMFTLIQPVANYIWIHIITSGNRTPGSRFYSDLFETSVCMHQLILKRCSKR